MGDRGITGFRKNGTDKLMYNHWGSSPAENGADMVQFCRETGIKEMNDIFDRIILVDPESKPDKEQIKECEQWADLSVNNGSLENWYCLLRKAQNNIFAYKNGLRYMCDESSFLKKVWCNYGYIINLDEEVLEFWIGGQCKPQKQNRYGTEIIFSYEGVDYYPCRLEKSFPLNSLSDDKVPF